MLSVHFSIIPSFHLFSFSSILSAQRSFFPFCKRMLGEISVNTRFDRHHYLLSVSSTPPSTTIKILPFLTAYYQHYSPLIITFGSLQSFKPTYKRSLKKGKPENFPSGNLKTGVQFTPKWPISHSFVRDTSETSPRHIRDSFETHSRHIALLFDF